MTTTATTAQWYNLDPDHGLLELDEHLTGGVGLELHVVFTSRWRWLSWWQRDDGAWLGMAKMGQA